MAVKSTEFKPRKTKIEGLIFFDISFPSDNRGWFQEKFQKAKLVQAGLPDSFQVVQNNISYNKKRGVTRGFHAEPWDKYISVVKGRVFVAYLDLRKGPGFGNIVTAEVDNKRAVYLPRGVANAFQTLDDDTFYVYSTSDHWRPDNYDSYTFVNLADKTLDIAWPIPLRKAVISDRDKNHPSFNGVRPMEF